MRTGQIYRIARIQMIQFPYFSIFNLLCKNLMGISITVIRIIGIFMYKTSKCMILNDDRALIWFLLCKNIVRYHIVLYHDC